MKRVIILIAWITIVTAANGQDWKALNNDELFNLAREKAFNKERELAREMLQTILTRNPGYDDARVLLGRTYAWDGQRDNARTEFKTVLEKTKYLDAYRALADVEMWDDKYTDALKTANAGLEHFPTDEELLYKKANALHKLEKDDEALSVLQQLLTLDPSDEQGLELLKDIRTSRKKYNFGLSYGVDFFNRSFDPAHYSSMQLGKITRWGSATARVNYAHRFDTDGVQGEIDLYPRIVDGIYAYVNYGYSSTDLFPQHRIGGELFSKLPYALEASAGFRYLYFDGTTDVIMYTGSVGWYFSDYWLSARTYITPDKRTGTSASGVFTLRKYLSNAESYLSLSAGFGFSPDIRRIQSSAGLATDEIYVLKAHRVGIGYQKLLKNDFMILASADLSRQELIFDTGNFINITSVNAGFRKKF